MPVTIVMVASLEALALRAVPEKLRLKERNQNVRNETRKIQLRRVDKVVIRIQRLASSRHTSTLTAPQSSKVFCSFATTKTSHTFAHFFTCNRGTYEEPEKAAAEPVVRAIAAIESFIFHDDDNRKCEAWTSSRQDPHIQIFE
jgi:hypothetical protein